MLHQSVSVAISMADVCHAGADADLYLYAVTHAQTAVFNIATACKVSKSAAMPPHLWRMLAASQKSHETALSKH